MSDELSDDVVDSGMIPGSWLEWQLVRCANPDVALKKGKHLILEIANGGMHWRWIPNHELAELRRIAFELAEKYAESPGRYRVDFNGPGCATVNRFHCHIKLPFGDDKLRRLVGDG